MHLFDALIMNELEAPQTGVQKEPHSQLSPPINLKQTVQNLVPRG